MGFLIRSGNLLAHLVELARGLLKLAVHQPDTGCQHLDVSNSRLGGTRRNGNGRLAKDGDDLIGREAPNAMLRELARHRS
jgi:hypothetical protein